MVNYYEEARNLGQHILTSVEAVKLDDAREELAKDPESKELQSLYQSALNDYNTLITRVLNIIVLTATGGQMQQGCGGGCASCGKDCGGENE